MRRIFVLLTILLVVAVVAAGCASSAPVVTGTTHFDTGVDPNSWATIPAGEFLMGFHNHRMMVDYDYQMMVTDVTNAQYAKYLNEALAAGKVKIEGNKVMGYYPGDKFRGHRHEKKISAGYWLHVPLDDPGLKLKFDGKTFTVKPGYENHPMVDVTWFGAKAYCEFYGWRLPTEIEWEKAARGTDGRPFPWGGKISGRNANFYASRDPFEKGPLGKHGDTTPVGFYNGKTYNGYETLDSPSPYGLYDMAGNVWQWTGNVYPYEHYRYMRGGSKDNYEYNLRAWRRNNAGPDYYAPNVGFRCARNVK